MSGTKLNLFTSPDPAFASAVECFAASMRGKLRLSLTHWDDTTVPAIAAGSIAECDGDLYEFEAEEAISTTDPITSATVADGIVYVMLIPAAGAVTAAFTATPPVWDALLYGWYCAESGFENCRYVAGCTKASAAYSGKGYFNNRLPVGHVKDFHTSIIRFPYMSIYGKTLSRTGFAEFFAEVGEIYGAGDGSTTFLEPDPRGREIIGLDNQGGVAAGRVDDAVALGDTGGVETHLHATEPAGGTFAWQPLNDRVILTSVSHVPPFIACNKAVKFI